MRILKISILILFIFGCVPENKHRELRGIKTLCVIPGVNNGEVDGFTHYVLVKGLSREYIDSLTILKLSMDYIDTVKSKKPVSVISFFSSDKKFIPNEISQDMNEINKSCLVTIVFDVVNSTPKTFVFYGDDGEIIYWGLKWQNKSIELGY